jgi:hypothetical protein
MIVSNAVTSASEMEKVQKALHNTQDKVKDAFSSNKNKDQTQSDSGETKSGQYDSKMAPASDTSFAAHMAEHFRSYEQDREMTSTEAVYATSSGAAVPHPYETQRVGENGPLLLQDFHLIDLLSHFDRERIPERVVHAKGSGAHGFFECTDPIPDLSSADLFSARGKKCPVTVRFSTVGGESGSHDLARDPRGFAVKFRTEEGKWHRLDHINLPARR